MDDLDRVLSAYGSVAEYNRVQDEEDYNVDYDYTDNQDYLDIEPEFTWEIVSECNDDDGKTTCYATKYNGNYYWVSHLENGWCIEMKCSDGEFRPINSSCEGFLLANDAMQHFEENAAEWFGEVIIPADEKSR